MARGDVISASKRPLGDLDIGLAVNSRMGRSQDQLHVHVACVAPSLAARVRSFDPEISAKSWYRLPFSVRGRRYWAIRLETKTLADVNVFATAATLLRISPGKLENLTFAVLPSSDIAVRGFYLLADQYTTGQHGEGHAEFLLDDSCSKD